MSKITHLAVHPRDRAAWGAKTVCGKNGPSTFNVKKQDCSKCTATLVAIKMLGRERIAALKIQGPHL